MKSAFSVLMICLFFVACGEKIEPLKPLQKGTANTITLSTGDVVYDIHGEWDAILDGGMGRMETTLKITQEGNRFVGIILSDKENWYKGDELIKGELVKNGFKSIQRNTIMRGWISETIGKIDEGCNKMVVKADYGVTTLILTLNRK